MPVRVAYEAFVSPDQVPQPEAKSDQGDAQTEQKPVAQIEMPVVSLDQSITDKSTTNVIANDGWQMFWRDVLRFLRIGRGSANTSETALSIPEEQPTIEPPVVPWDSMLLSFHDVFVVGLASTQPQVAITVIVSENLIEGVLRTFDEIAQRFLPYSRWAQATNRLNLAMRRVNSLSVLQLYSTLDSIRFIPGIKVEPRIVRLGKNEVEITNGIFKQTIRIIRSDNDIFLEGDKIRIVTGYRDIAMSDEERQRTGTPYNTPIYGKLDSSRALKNGDFLIILNRTFLYEAPIFFWQSPRLRLLNTPRPIIVP